MRAKKTASYFILSALHTIFNWNSFLCGENKPSRVFLIDDAKLTTVKSESSFDVLLVTSGNSFICFR